MVPLVRFLKYGLISIAGDVTGGVGFAFPYAMKIACPLE